MSGKINKRQLINASPLPKFALMRPVTVLMSLVALLVVGFIAYKQIAVELMPAGYTPPFLGIWTPYPNANPEEVEQYIARPVEEEVRTLQGVQRVVTNSSTRGCWTFIEFSQEIDMDIAYSQLRDRMDRVKAELPDDIERLYLRKWSEDDDPVIWVAIIPDEPLDDPYYFTEQVLKKPLERIEGVANVEIGGADEKSILIHINQDLVKSFKVNLYEIVTALRSDNFSISSGHLESGGQKIYVRSMGKFKSLEAVREIPIHGPNIKVKDIAEVKYDVPERHWKQRIDGQAAIELAIYKESIANTVDVCQAIEEQLADFKKDPRYQNYRIEILFNQGEFILESVNNLKNAGIWGAFFAFFVLYFFLRRMRMTIILNIAIPLSIMVSMTVLYFIGWTMNLITMMGLMISVGMVVDNSIVVLENIYHKRANGLNDVDAAAKGSSEVYLAVIMATMTTMVVFLPLILMSDDLEFQFIMLRIGLPVVFALGASLFVALIFIPLAASRIVSRRKVTEAPVIIKLNRVYSKTLAWVLNHRIEAFIILILTYMSMELITDSIPKTDNAQGNINDFRLFLDMPDNYTLDDAENLIIRIEDSIRVKAEAYNVRTINSRFRNNNGRVQVFLFPEPQENWYDVIYKGIAQLGGFYHRSHMPREEVIEDLKKRLPDFPGVKVRTSWRQEGGQDASVNISLYGDDTNKLASLAEEVERRLKKIPDIISIETDRETGEDEIRLVIKREQAQKFGISPRMISGTIMYALRGIQLPKYQTEEKEIDMLIQLREEDRRNFEQLKNITFFSRNGKEVPLAAIADFQIKKGFGEIHREDGKTYLGIKANATTQNVGELYAKVDKVMEDFNMPYGYSWSKGERFRRMQESDDNTMQAVVLAVCFVFILMGILFESFVLPLSVLIAIPFSFVGAYWMLYITNTTLDMMGQIGFIILIGIVVNNAIVLVDLINRLRKEGYSRFDAIVEAGRNRFRPILMTAFTTIGGLIPMAVGNTKMIGISYSPMGRVIIGGLIFSTAISLLAVPWAYTVFDDLRNYFRKLTAGILVKRKITATEETDISFAGK
ncbi:MAG: efflux RND transporter permease subunit [Calditrichaceae bacterium]|nr:efflux RND transporter permease subunit [Calditrichaceae bacterium]